MESEIKAAPDRVALMHDLVEEVTSLVRWKQPEPACWLEAYAGASYCWDCAQLARAKELGLACPPREPARKFTWDRTEQDEAEIEAYESFKEGIGGGYWGQGESDNVEHCDTCGKLLAYSLTDYGARHELAYWLECRIRPIGDGWHPESSYGLEKLRQNLCYNDPPEWMVEAVISISQFALATTH